MGGACRRVRGTRWWFRCRVPGSLTTRLGLREVTRSLRTSCPREAMRRGRLAWLATETAFRQMASDLSLDAERALVLVRRLLQEALDNSPTAEEIVRRWREDDTSLAGQLFTRSLLEVVPGIPEDGRKKLMLHMDRIAHRLEAANARERAEVEQERAALAVHRAERAAEREGEAQSALAQLSVRVAELEREVEVERRIRERLDARVLPAPAQQAPAEPAAIPAPPASTPANSDAGSLRPSLKTRVNDLGPLFSANESNYLTRRAAPQLGRRALGRKSVEDAEAAFWLWRGLAGDRPMLEYTREQADDLRVDMLRMLAFYGKGGRKYDMREKFGPRHWIDEAEKRQKKIDEHNAALPEGHPKRKPDVERMAFRTVKKHYGALSGYWKWLESRKVLPRGSNIFDEWDWPGTKGRPDDRDAWSVDDLNALLRSSWFAPEAHGTDYWWATVIAMFSGLRVEEIARLRTAHDFQEFDGILCMVLQNQGDWSPKSEAGERVVPVHRQLHALGLRDLIQRRAAEDSYRLLPSLKRGPRGNLGAYLSKDFSAHTIAIGVGDKTVFHSWRHNIRTQLSNVRELQETWIDAILGHRAGSGSPGQRSVGATIYLKGIGAANLDWAIQQVDYGPKVELRRLDPTLLPGPETATGEVCRGERE